MEDCHSASSATGAVPQARNAPLPIQVKGLITRLGETTVHDGLNLEVRAGEILGLVGASGSGKSVLLRVLLGLMRPTSGVVNLFGVDIAAAPEVELQKLTAKWGVVFQENALFSEHTVRENVEIAIRERVDLPEKLITELADMKIALVELQPEVADQYPAELSGGMRRRAALARALALDPPLLLLDEPTSGLDPVVAAKLDSLILGLRQMLGITILFITHDLDSMNRVCDHVAVLADKKIVAIGTPRELASSSHPFVKSYFGGQRASAALGTDPGPDTKHC